MQFPIRFFTPLAINQGASADERPVCAVFISTAQPNRWYLCSVRECVSIRIPEPYSSAIILQDGLCGSTLQKFPGGFDDEVYRLSDSVAQPKDLGGFQHHQHLQC